MWDCLKSLFQLGSHYKVILAWVLGHKGHKGNEKADKFASKRSSTARMRADPYCGVVKSTIKTLLKQSTIKESQNILFSGDRRSYHKPINSRQANGQNNNKALY